MRVVKAVLVVSIGLFCIITLFSLLIPSQVRVSRAVLINNTTPIDVYNQTSRFDNWKNWHPIFTIDSAKIVSSAGGRKYAGSCTILHRGKQVQLSMVFADTNQIKFSVTSVGENDIANELVLTQYPDQHAVQVEWRAITQLHWYPWDKFYGIFLDKLTGPGYETALNGLKSFIETGNLPGPITVENGTL